ncbi:MATE family efflux transporter [Beduini massiliensis]|uniref:MATE family efflux transporter n=1 Tax=Beduini massiliensis TaxID=1585974 RepID=UPI00059AAD1B|nr:MATE family efflux transporter [Beduini massiliensis]
MNNELNSEKENELGTLPIKKLLLKMAVPVILSMLVQSLYNIVDSIYVSRISEDALTAISLATPISSLIASVTVGLSVGVNAILSKKLGEKKYQEANQAAGNGIVIEWLCFIVFFIFGMFFTRMFYEMQTSNLHIQQLGTAYTSIVCLFSFGVCTQVIMERLLISTGKTIGSMCSLLTGAVVNIILDPIMIFGYFGIPALGISGAAIATVIAQFCAALVAFGFNIFTNKEIHFHLGMLKPNFKIIKDIFIVGLPAALTQAISPLLVFGMNQILLGFTTAAPAVYVIYVRLQGFVMMPVWGLKNTVVSIISYNYGAKNKARMIQAMKYCLFIVWGCAVLGIVIMQGFTNDLLAIFNASGEILSIGMKALKIISLCFPFLGTTLIIGSYLQALGESNKTLLTSIMEFILMLLIAALLANTGNIDIVWYAFVMTEAIVVFIACFFMRSVYKTKIALLQKTE